MIVKPLVCQAKKVFMFGYYHRYHKAHQREADGIVKTVESQFGKTDPKHMKAATEYARDVCKSLYFAPWLKAYTAVAREFREGWLPHNFFGMKVVPKIGSSDILVAA